MPTQNYLTGRTPLLVYQDDPRFSYCLYVPAAIRQVLVYIHGTYREATYYRDQLSGFAEANQVLVVAPLFPAGLIDPYDVDNYKHLCYRDIRFDQLLLGMLREICGRYGVNQSRFLLGGFSGGAQFVHRFCYLHADHLLGMSIAAPGRVTVLDDRFDWWPGTRDVYELFGQSVQSDLIADLPVQLIVGGEDTADITIGQDSPYWVEGANIAGTTRVERLDVLAKQYQMLGADVRQNIIPGVAHAWLPLLPSIKTFFQSIIGESQ